MKKFLFFAIATAMLGMTFTSCDEKENLNEEKNISCITKKDIESDSSISYLVEAVKFVCR